MSSFPGSRRLVLTSHMDRLMFCLKRNDESLINGTGKTVTKNYAQDVGTVNSGYSTQISGFLQNVHTMEKIASHKLWTPQGIYG